MQWCVCQTNIEISSNSALAVETVVSKKQCWLTVRKCTQTKMNSFTTKLSKVEQRREVAPNKRSDYSSTSHLFDACPVVKGHLGITNSVSAFVKLTPPEAQHMCFIHHSCVCFPPAANGRSCQWPISERRCCLSTTPGGGAVESCFSFILSSSLR